MYYKENILTYKSGKNWVMGNISDLKADLNALIKKTPNEIIIDLSSVEIIDSSGIGVIVTTFKSMKKIGGTIRVINASPAVFLFLQTLRIKHFFRIEQKGDGYSSAFVKYGY